MSSSKGKRFALTPEILRKRDALVLKLINALANYPFEISLCCTLTDINIYIQTFYRDCKRNDS